MRMLFPFERGTNFRSQRALSTGLRMSGAGISALRADLGHTRIASGSGCGQKIRKYENAANRIGASPSVEIANRKRALNILGGPMIAAGVEGSALGVHLCHLAPARPAAAGGRISWAGHDAWLVMLGASLPIWSRPPEAPAAGERNSSIERDREVRAPRRHGIKLSRGGRTAASGGESCRRVYARTGRAMRSCW